MTTANVRLSERRDGVEELVVDVPYHPSTVAALRSILAGRWDARTKVWRFPATPASARNLDQALPDGLSWAMKAQAYADVGDPSDRAEVVRLYRAGDELDDGSYDLDERLWRHQRAAVLFAEAGSSNLGWSSGTLLYLGLGSGKTLATLEYARRNVPAGEPFLVVCPKAVIPTWGREAEKHYPGEFEVLVLRDGSTARRADDLAAALVLARSRGDRLMVVVNYDAFWQRRLGEAILDTEWQLVVADEVHRLKSPGGKASRFAARLALRVPRRLGLSGTPCPHSPMDAYGVFRFIDPGVFGTSLTKFRARFAVMGGYGGYEVVGYQRQEEFNARFYSLTIRVDRDVLDLPEEHHVYREVELPESAMRVYRELERDFVVDLEGGTVTAAHALTRLLRLQQVTSGYAPLDREEGIETDWNDERVMTELHTARREALEEVLDELPPGEPVVVFCRFRWDLRAVAQACQSVGRDYMELSGQADDAEQWRAASGGEVLGVQVQSGSEGVDLVRAAVVVYYSLDYSLGRYEQSLRRVHRPGQDRPVTYLHLLARGTVDESVYRALRERRDVLETILDDRSRRDELDTAETAAVP